MGREKEEASKKEEAAYDAARRNGRTCPCCGAVIPYGERRGEHGECPACVGTLKDN